MPIVGHVIFQAPHQEGNAEGCNKQGWNQDSKLGGGGGRGPKYKYKKVYENQNYHASRIMHNHMTTNIY